MTIVEDTPAMDEIRKWSNCWNFSEAKLLWAHPTKFSEDSASLDYILAYEKNIFHYQKTELIEKYNLLSYDIKARYPLFENLKEFYDCKDTNAGFVIAKILDIRKYKKDYVDIYDESTSGICYTYVDPEDMNSRPEKEQKLIDEEITQIYKRDYEDPVLGLYPQWPFLKKATEENTLETYAKKRYLNSKKLLKSELTYGFFLRKKNTKDIGFKQTSLNELQKVILQTGSKEPTELCYTISVNSNKSTELKFNSGAETKVLFCSDIHVGSYTCCTEDIENMIQKINQDHTIKYVVMTGDLIDGIDAYPNQKRDLKIRDYVKQYTQLARLLNMIRADIRLIFCPGNHDFVSKVEPQVWTQEIFNIFKNILKERPLLFVPNPSYLDLEGVKVYLSHGIGLCYLSNAIGEFNIKNPAEILNFLVDHLHVCPIQGSAPIRATIPQVYHIIPSDFNILNVGHIHKQSSFYRNKNCLLLSNGAFQNITPYMTLMGVEPNVSCVWTVNLKDLSCESWDCTTNFTKNHTYKAVEAELKLREKDDE